MFLRREIGEENKFSQLGMAVLIAFINSKAKASKLSAPAIK